MTANSANVTGNVNANTGSFGGSKGFRIESGKAYTNGKSVWCSSASGLYLGSDGISLGANSPFRVDSNGNLTANSGTIGGIKISTNSIYSANGNFTIDNNGYGVFKDVSINGVRAGSEFGGVSFNGSGTSGNFGNGFYAGSSFGLNGGALNDFNNLVVNRIDANYINTTVLNAGFITADTVAANYATIGNLNAANAKISTLESRKIKTSELETDNVNGHEVRWRIIDFITAINPVYNSNKLVTDVLTEKRRLYFMCAPLALT